MRIPRVRFTVRRMMVVVAVVAADFLGVNIWQKAVFYRSKIAHHARILDT